MSKYLSLLSDKSCHTNAHLFHTFFDVASCSLYTNKKMLRLRCEQRRKTRKGDMKEREMEKGINGASMHLGLHLANLLCLLPSCSTLIMQWHPWGVIFCVLRFPSTCFSFGFSYIYMRIKHCSISFISLLFFSPHNPRHLCISAKSVRVLYRITRSRARCYCSVLILEMSIWKDDPGHRTFVFLVVECSCPCEPRILLWIRKRSAKGNTTRGEKKREGDWQQSEKGKKKKKT